MIEYIALFGLAYNCPKLQRQDNCLLKEFDYLTFNDKVGWIEGLSQEEKEMILEPHQVCTWNR